MRREKLILTLHFAATRFHSHAILCIFLIAPRDRYEGLKEEGKLSKFMEKKRKKNAAKDHRWLPSKRQDRG